MLYKYEARIRQNGIRANVILDVDDDTFRPGREGASRHDILVRLHAGKIFTSLPDIEEPHLDYLTEKPRQDMMNITQGTIRASVLRYDGEYYTIEIPPKQNINHASLDDIVKQLGLTNVKRIELYDNSIPLEYYSENVQNKKPIRVEIYPGKGPNFIVEFQSDDITVEDGGVAYWAENVLPNLGKTKDWHVLRQN